MAVQQLSNERTTAYTDGAELVFERVFDAPRDLVWKVLTDPERVTNWWGPHGYTTTVVRYGPDRNESSQTLAASVVGASRQLDGALSGTLELVVGRDYSGTRAVQVSSPTPTPSATASLDTITASRAVCTS